MSLFVYVSCISIICAIRASSCRPETWTIAPGCLKDMAQHIASREITSSNSSVGYFGVANRLQMSWSQPVSVRERADALPKTPGNKENFSPVGFRVVVVVLHDALMELRDVPTCHRGIE